MMMKAMATIIIISVVFSSQSFPLISSWNKSELRPLMIKTKKAMIAIVEMRR